METFLQSNEIKIPKSNKVHPSKIDYKSSFARSLTYSNNCDSHLDGTKSLDFEINLSPCNLNENASCDNVVKCLDEDLVVGRFNESFNKSDEDKERQLWSKQQHQQISNDNNSSSDAEILRLRKECQTLIEENRRLQARNPLKMSSLPYGSLQYVECNSNNNNNSGVESVVLQTKIETLQWQLRQVENSRQMYRCIMEEVARYLEKCHFNFEKLQKRERDKATLERSKSIANIAKGKVTDIHGVTDNDGRARSSSNLHSLPTQKTHKSSTLLSDISYSAFKDFTWRRAPKNKATSVVEIKPEKFTFQSEEANLVVVVPPSFEGNLASPFETKPNTCNEIEIDAEKLSKEAFRLSRTVQNFLNTHEPILSQATCVSEPATFPRTTIEQQRNDFLFGFDRESHLSLRSTDESSVHSSSNSSNSNKEDDDPTILPIIATNKNNAPAKAFVKSKRFSTCHQTEDESGFSSMNSFHEIGLPLHSTMISVNTSGTSSDESNSETIKIKKPAAAASIVVELKDEVGLPSPPAIKASHRRYDSTPISVNQSSKMKILENDEKTMKVLWV